MSIAHVVTFTFTPTTSSETIAALSRALDTVSDFCTGIESYRHGPDLHLRPGTADYAVTAVFRDQQALTDYLNDRHHQRVNTEFAACVAAKSSVQFPVS
ncbi:Dabb family protein [Rhodococcus chondri]|uniref:Dabb family protein n=1 Tax=Rhodococcus chondri TaxID=3065941 RepID=A0ABU7JRU0_9NOCA|nr:Dabb family protein [Rhodococcus sp. CC-R104]MEE2032545.1 Dabb family protein [Rhodococcus sp. CC-R104]